MPKRQASGTRLLKRSVKVQKTSVQRRSTVRTTKKTKCLSAAPAAAATTRRRGIGGKHKNINELADKRRLSAAATNYKPTRGAKRSAAAAVIEDSEDESDCQLASTSTARQLTETLNKATAASATASRRRQLHVVDSYCHQLVGGKVFGGYDCKLNNTNIAQNNNTFYLIQLLSDSDDNCYVWTRWGRVGEAGASDLKGPMDVEEALTMFEKKFHDKTGITWCLRDQFKPVAGKYTLLDMASGDDFDDIKIAAAVQSSNCLQCTLDASTQELVQLIFSHDMFQETLKDLNIDTSKLPLGKISKVQIAKGFKALEKIEAALKNKQTSKLVELSSQFYTVIPHNFGRKLPATISTPQMLHQKIHLLTVLADIELAQTMQKEKETDSSGVKSKTGKKVGETGASAKCPHPVDELYQLLECRLTLVNKKSKIFKMIEKYHNATKDWDLDTLQEVWEVDRHGESERFAVNDKIENRKLLWHGTSVAVVAAILKSGLRIMPHSGGAVGKGIYFASQFDKSAEYAEPTNDGTGIMLLCEVVLGKEHHIQHVDYTLTRPPDGCHSVIATGSREPDPKKNVTTKLERHTVVVPVGESVSQDKFKNSAFSHSEYVVYNEHQCRIRYLLKLTHSGAMM